MDGDEAPAHGDSNDNTDHNNNNNNPGKASKRDRFKGALSRTKSKFKKHDNKSEAEINDEVNDFLAGGRTSTSSWTSGKDTLRPGTITTTQGYSSSLETSPADQAASPRPSTSDSASISRHSPRKITVPKIDVSNSQRWPAAQPLSPQGPAEGAAGFLRPEYHGRSQSASSLTKRKGRARGLSVTFIDDPPTVIGEGGDDAPTPPLEISKAKARARSVSPMSPRVRQRPAGASRPTAAGGAGAYEYPRPPAAPASSPSSQHEPPDVLRPRGLQRVQTGLSPSAATASLGLDKEFEMTLQIGNQANPPGREVASNSPEIIAPRPVRPVQPPPLVVERPDTSVSVVHEAQSSSSSSSGRADDFREGDVLRMHHDPNIPTIEENTPASGSSREVSPVKQRQYQNFV
ncbi:hypothetical protein PV08_03398 [Exophiala spinifera]|uniref:Uncharacterized protein n=1 Tax=Exophiala spinifera TaxID=91928 RepID=A0A0D1YV04_9EURO|nr:uncharacterized protein PV08_03398 [Exophiala spinifera]KIW19106.1 hypothetical protein PV08_03398 [Exophiala spinifera]